MCNYVYFKDLETRCGIVQQCWPDSWGQHFTTGEKPLSFSFCKADDNQVQYDGNVTWLTQGIYTSKCEIDVTYYPMDAQNCSLKFASWSQEITKVWSMHCYLIWCIILFKLNLSVGTEITQKQILTLYTVNKEFELKEFFAVRHETPDPCCVEKFADVT